MSVRPNSNSETKISKARLDEVIKSNVRGSDNVIMHDETTYFIILTNTNLSGAMIVWSRITKTIGEEGVVCGCIISVEDNSLEDLQELVVKGLNVAVTAPNNFIAITEDNYNLNEGRWLKTSNTHDENTLKFFKQLFDKKLQATIKPVFEFAKKSAKRRYPKIDFEVSIDTSSIRMVATKGDKISELVIEHPGSTFLNVSHNHQGLDSPENKTTKMEFNDINETAIRDIIDAFLTEYTSYAN